MERGQRRATRYLLRAKIFGFGAAFLGAAACGSSGRDGLFTPVGQGGQATSQGGSSSASSGVGGEPSGEAGSGAGGEASSGGEASVAGAGGFANGGAAVGGVGGNSSGGGVGGKATGGVGGKATGGVGGKATGGVGGKATGGVGGKATGGVGGKATGGVGGKAAGGGAGAGGREGGEGGEGGEAATCPGKCDANADCRVIAGIATCTCRAGFVGDGQTCARPTSCNELHEFAPNLASGAYLLRPTSASAEINAYCEMTAEGGGWTLVLNDGPSFDPAVPGVADAQCYRQNCTSLAYSTVPVAADVMLDLLDGPIVATNYVARVIVAGVEARSRGKTVRELFTDGPFYLEREDNSNLAVRLSGTGACSETLPIDLARLVCDTCAAGTACDAPVITFGDADPGCVDDPMFAFAIGGAMTYTTPWGNCAGWPQQPNPGANFYPDNFRVWVR